MFLHFCGLIMTGKPIIDHGFAFFGDETGPNSIKRGTNSREKSEIRSGVASICILVCSYKNQKNISDLVITNPIL